MSRKLFPTQEQIRAAAPPPVEKEGTAALPLNFGKRLAHTDKTVRDKGFKVLKLWLKKNPELERLDYMKLWKGLYFGMWMSDKRPVQQELSVNIALLINDIPQEKQILWVDTFWETMAEAWEKLDKHRMNKYLLFLRIVLAETFKVARERGWKPEFLKDLARIFTRLGGGMVYGSNVHSVGLLLQFCLVMWDELQPQLDEGPEVAPEVMLAMLEPFIEATLYTANVGLIKHVHEFVLRQAKGELAKAVASKCLEAAKKPRVPILNQEAFHATVTILGVEGEEAEALAEAAKEVEKRKPKYREYTAMRGGQLRVIKRKVKPRKLGKKVAGLAEGDAAGDDGEAKAAKTGEGKVMSPLMMPKSAVEDGGRRKKAKGKNPDRPKAKVRGKAKAKAEPLTKQQLAARSSSAQKRKRKNRAAKEARPLSAKKKRRVGDR